MKRPGAGKQKKNRVKRKKVLDSSAERRAATTRGRNMLFRRFTGLKLLIGTDSHQLKRTDLYARASSRTA